MTNLHQEGININLSLQKKKEVNVFMNFFPLHFHFSFPQLGNILHFMLVSSTHIINLNPLELFGHFKRRKCAFFQYEWFKTLERFFSTCHGNKQTKKKHDIFLKSLYTVKKECFEKECRSHFSYRFKKVFVFLDLCSETGYRVINRLSLNNLV